MPYAQMLHIKTVVELSNLQLGKYKSRNKFCKHQMGVFKNEKKKITCALYGLLKNAYKFFSWHLILLNYLPKYPTVSCILDPRQILPKYDTEIPFTPLIPQ